MLLLALQYSLAKLIASEVKSNQKQKSPSISILLLSPSKDDNNVTVISREFFQYLASNLRNTPYPGVDNYTRYAIAQSRIRPLFDDIINDITWFQYPKHVPPCRESKHPASVFVAIISAPGYFHKRESIRNTYDMASRYVDDDK